MALTRPVVLVGRVKYALAANVGHAHTVAVVADAGDGVREEPPLMRLLEVAKPNRVEERDRPRPHRNDVAEYAANSRRSTLERLDRRRVVVALDFESDC